MLVGQSPILERHRPLFGNLPDAHIDNLTDGIIGGEYGFGLGEFSHHSVIAFDSICGIDDLTNLLREFKKCAQFRPIPVPGLQDAGILFIPLLPEFLSGVLGLIQINRAIDFFQVRTDCLSVFVGYKLAAVSNLMDDAKLIFRLGKYCVDGIAKL